MHYWNDQNFDGLADVATHYAEKPGYENFSRFCHLMEKGLRNDALAALDKFVCEVQSWPVEKQRDFADEHLRLCIARPEIHQLQNFHLSRLAESIIQAWHVDEPNVLPPARWFGYLRGDEGLLKRALEIEPKDPLAASILADLLLERVDFQTHHLQESILLADIGDVQANLAEVGAILAHVELPDRRLEERFAHYTGLIKAWEEFGGSESAGDFPDWCRANDYDFAFGITVYYE